MEKLIRFKMIVSCFVFFFFLFKGSEEFMRVVALQLAIVSQLVQQALLQLEKVLPPPKAPLSLSSPLNVNTNGLSRKRRRRRRRRRRGSSEGSSDLSEGKYFIIFIVFSD